MCVCVCVCECAAQCQRKIIDQTTQLKHTSAGAGSSEFMGGACGCDVVLGGMF